MTHNFSEHIQAIFQELEGIPVQDKRSFTKNRLLNEPRLATEVEAFLLGEGGTDIPSDLLVEAFLDIASSFSQEEGEQSHFIGVYRILRPLGKGGMGEVYLAYQEEPLRRAVALKVIGAKSISPEIKARFHFEYQVLSRLNHPNIARVLDAGQTDEEVPFFAMEYFPGVAITTFCKANDLNTKDRIQLFLQVCEGVAHAHTRGLIHRDLKPDNIMVRYCQDRPLAKVIDFGVAAMTEECLDFFPIQLVEGQIGTPRYMSPEQKKAGRGMVLDIRSDVYSLGLILFELLLGKFPHHLTTEPPSAKPFPEALNHLSKRGGRLLRSQLRGDLGTILNKATAPNPQDRYASAKDLVIDLNLYLENRPIKASTAGGFYRFGKLVSRRRWPFVAIVSAIVLMLSGLIMTSKAYMEASAARREAITSRDQAAGLAIRSQSMYAFLQNMLSAPNPYQNSRDVRVIDLLDLAGRRLQYDFPDQPDIRAALSADLAETYLGLGNYTQALFYVDTALELNRNRLKMNTPEALDLLGRRAFVLLKQKDYVGAEALYRDALSLQRNALGESHPIYFETKRGLAGALIRQGQLEKGLVLLEELKTEQLLAQGERHEDYQLTLRAIANVWTQMGRWEDAVALYRQILQIQEEILSPHHPSTLETYNSLATALSKLGSWSEEETVRRKLVQLRTDVLGEKHPDTLISIHLLSRVLYLRKDFSESEFWGEKAFALSKEGLGEEDPATLNILNDLALTKAGLGHQDEAGRLLEKYLTLCRTVYGGDHQKTLTGAINLADHYRSLGHYKQGVTLIENTISRAKKSLGDHHIVYIFAQFNLAELLEDQEYLVDAAAVYQHGLEQMPYAIAYSDPYTTHFRNLYAGCLRKLGRNSEAEALLLKNWDGCKTQNNPYSEETIEGLFTLYQAWGKQDEVQKWSGMHQSTTSTH